MTYEVALSLGTNIEPEDNMVRAVEAIQRSLDPREVSPVYETKPVAMEPGAGNFHNLCLIIHTDRRPGELKDHLRSIETEIGRDRSENENRELYRPRCIDIDILTYDPEPEEFEPSPEIQQQAYVVYPLADLMDPPGVLSVSSRSEWRARSSKEEILGTVDYDWPEAVEEDLKHRRADSGQANHSE